MAETERRARLEVELAQTHVHYAEVMTAREIFICEGMMSNLPSHARGGLQEGTRQVGPGGGGGWGLGVWFLVQGLWGLDPIRPGQSGLCGRVGVGV